MRVGNAICTFCFHEWKYTDLLDAVQFTCPNCGKEKGAWKADLRPLPLNKGNPQWMLPDDKRYNR